MSKLEREISKERLSSSHLVVISDHGMDGVGGIPSSLKTYAEVWTPQLGGLDLFSYRGEKNFIIEAHDAARTIEEIRPDSILLIHPTRYGLATFYMLSDELRSRVTAYWRTKTDQPHERKFDSTVDEVKHFLRKPTRELVMVLRRSMTRYGVRHIANSRSVAHSLVMAGIANNDGDIAIHRPPLQPRPGRSHFNFEQRGPGFEVLVVSRISSEKGLENIKWLSSQLRGSNIDNWRIRVVGPVSDARYFQALQKETEGMPIEFVGAKGWPEMADYYAGSHLLFMPSRTESWGQVTIEAIREGTPVLCLPSPGSAEIFEETGSSIGVLADICQEVDVAEFLNLINNPVNWSFLSANCVNESKRYQAEVLCQRLLEDVVFGK